MIRITVELVSAVHPSRNRTLGVAKIWNTGQGGPLFGEYGAEFSEAPEQMDFEISLSKMEPKTGQIWRRGGVKRFNRKTRGCWDLIYLALKQIVGDRNVVREHANTGGPRP